MPNSIYPIVCIILWMLVLPATLTAIAYQQDKHERREKLEELRLARRAAQLKYEAEVAASVERVNATVRSWMV